MPTRTGWTREQQLIALRLYMRLPFGKLSAGNRDIIALAAKIDRTPGALVMKACNFASLDPEFRKSNRKGLTGVSASDSVLWKEFEANSEEIAAEAENVFDRLVPQRARSADSELNIPTGETDIVRTIRARRVQSFFRAAVLVSYGERCCISGLAIPELLVASHIVPWAKSVKLRAQPTNGLCLNALFDRAFDRGLMAIDADHRVIISQRLKDAAESAMLGCSLREAEGRQIMLPQRFPPSRAFPIIT